MNEYIFPLIGIEKDLPVHVNAVGIFNRFDILDSKKGYPFFTLIYVSKGQATITANNEYSHINSNRLVVLDLNTPFTVNQITKTCEVYILLFGGKKRESERKYPDNKKAFYNRIIDNNIIENFFKKIYSTSLKLNPHVGFANSHILYSLLMEIKNQNYNYTTDNKEPKFEKLQQIISYMHNNLKGSITLEDISEYVGVSQQYICRLFKEYLNTRPFEYLTNMRITKSKTLLLSKMMTISEIYHEVGFSDCSYFCAAFKKNTGYSPTQFQEIFCL